MLATVASVNSANRLRQLLLSKYSVNSRVIQTPSSLTKEGCGYSIRFTDSDKSAVTMAAKELKINIRSFFLEKTENSKPVYIKV